MPKFRRAPEVAELAREIIARHHPHLLDIRIEYVFGDAAPEANGRVTLGKAMRISGVNAELARLEDGSEDEDDEDAFFCIVMYDDVWPNLNDCRRTALLDHGLCHCKVKISKTGVLKLYIAPHDLEEFTEIVERHGLWSKDVQKIAAAIKQAQLSFPHMTIDTPAPKREAVAMTIEVAGHDPIHTSTDTLQRIAKQFKGEASE
jgi:hypothetical protein